MSTSRSSPRAERSVADEEEEEAETGVIAAEEGALQAESEEEFAVV